jgi:hypothetical protein
MIQYLLLWLITVIAAERTTELVTTSEFFLWLRNFFAKKAELPEDPTKPVSTPAWYWKFLNKVTTCGYCFSVWAALLYVPALLGGAVAADWLVYDFLIKWVALHGLANAYHAAYELLRRGRSIAIEFVGGTLLTSGGFNVNLLNPQPIPEFLDAERT